MSKKSKRLNRWLMSGAGALAAAAAVSGGSCAGASDPLLDMLIKKGILTEQEAKEIKVEAETNAVPSSASKWKINNAIKEIDLFGDVRFRYEYRSARANPTPVGDVPLTTSDRYTRERWRYALRFGIRGDLFDDFNYGLRLETSTNPRSPWVTFGDDTNPTPFAKNNDGIGVGQIYLGWHPTSWYEMTVGKMPQPLYTTPMVWDSDLNPEGAFEKFKFSAGPVDLFADFGQFVYMDTNPDTHLPSSDTWLLTWQLGGVVKLDKYSSFKLAPVVYTYAGQGSPTTSNNGLDRPFVGQPDPASNGGNNLTQPPIGTVNSFNQNGINDLLIVEVPAEYNLTLGKYHGRLFGDYAYNVNGNTRARNAFTAGTVGGAFPGVTSAVTGQNTAYQVGLGIGNEGPVYGPTQGLVYGSTSKKNTWEARVYWQHVEQYALDVNLLDSDFFEGRANLEGIYSAVAYGITDGIIGTVRFGHANVINKQLGTGGNNSDLPALNPVRDYNVVQLDLTWRF